MVGTLPIYVTFYMLCSAASPIGVIFASLIPADF
jgi:hypothetical protein